MAHASLPYWLGFHRIPSVGPARIGQLLEFFGTLEDAWFASAAELLAAGLPRYSVERIVAERERIDPEREVERLESCGVAALTLEDPAYPRLLRQVQQPPPVLFVRGELRPEDDLAVGIVGTRRATTYGRDMAARISSELAASGVTIVSGLALGIDTVAHRSALEAGGRTIAVLACGLDTVYPPSNRRLAASIVEQGAVVSEQPLGTRPDARNFPARNRIISGLSRGVVVVEAPERSGALITTAFAADQGRDVFAVPGSAASPASAGCHRLIRDGATLVTSAAHVLEALDVPAAQVQVQARLELPGSPQEQLLYSLLGAEPRHVDELAYASGLPIHEASGTLLALELKGLARQAGAQHYVRA